MLLFPRAMPSKLPVWNVWLGVSFLGCPTLDGTFYFIHFSFWIVLQCMTIVQFIYPFYHWVESRLLHFKKLLNALIDIYVWKCKQVSLGEPPACNCQVTDFLILNFQDNMKQYLEKCCAICFPILIIQILVF